MQQVVELTAIRVELWLQVEDGFEHLLHLGDGGSDGDFPSQLAAKVVRGGQVVGMGMGFQNPLHGQPLPLDESYQAIRRMGAGAA